MSNLSTVTDNMLPVASETFVDNLAAGISAGADTVPLLSLAEYSDGDSVVLTVDPGTADQATFIGKVDGNEVIDVEWTEGNVGASHAAGATVIDYDSATHYNVVTKLLRMFANQDGSLKTTAVQAALNIPTSSSPDYTVLATAPNAIEYLGQRSYQVTIPSVNYTDRLNPGTRIRTVRNTAAPTQCTSLNGTTQYWTKTTPNKMTFTDDFAISAWVKLNTYGVVSAVASRYNGTSGWLMTIETDGTLKLRGNNGGSANASFVQSFQSIPLNKWVHITAQLDMSAYSSTAATSYVMIDGIDVPAYVGRGGTNPTSLVQAGNLEIGSLNGGSFFFNGKIAQVAIFNAKVTQATMRSYISQGITGTETSLASAFSFNGVTTDLNTATPNDLVAGAGSPSTTNADSPFGGQANGNISATVDYGIVQSATFAVDTILIVQVPEGCTLPTAGGISTMSYSAMKAPYGMPVSQCKWEIRIPFKITAIASISPAVSTWYQAVGIAVTFPVGSWLLGYSTPVGAIGTANNPRFQVTLSTSSSAETESELTSYMGMTNSSTGPIVIFDVAKFIQKDLTAAQTFYMNLARQSGGGTMSLLQIIGTDGGTYIYAQNAYL